MIVFSILALAFLAIALAAPAGGDSALVIAVWRTAMELLRAWWQLKVPVGI